MPPNSGPSPSSCTRRADAQLGVGLGDAAAATKRRAIVAEERLGARPAPRRSSSGTACATRLLALAERGAQDARRRSSSPPSSALIAASVGLAAISGCLPATSQPADGHARALAGEVGEHGELAQLVAVAERQRDRRLRRGVRLDACSVRAVDPQLGVDRAGALAQEREVALVDLREHLVRRPADVDRRA